MADPGPGGSGPSGELSSRFDRVHREALVRRRTVKWTLYGPDVLAAWVAEMDFDVAEPIRTALLEAVDREDFGYAPADSPELKAACAAFFAEAYGWDVSPRRIELVADVLEGIRGALDAFVPPHRGIVVPTPAYPPFFEIVALSGRAVVETPLVPFKGEDRAGGEGGATMVVKLHVPDQLLVPPELLALARQ